MEQQLMDMIPGAFNATSSSLTPHQQGVSSANGHETSAVLPTKASEPVNTSIRGDSDRKRRQNDLVNAIAKKKKIPTMTTITPTINAKGRSDSIQVGSQDSAGTSSTNTRSKQSQKKKTSETDQGQTSSQSSAKMQHIVNSCIGKKRPSADGIGKTKGKYRYGHRKV